MLNRDLEILLCSRFVNCELWSCDMNSTLGSVVPLAMFDYLRSYSSIYWSVLLVHQDVTTLHGHLPLFLIQLCSLAAKIIQLDLVQRLFLVQYCFLLTSKLFNFVAGGKSFTLPHSARDACGIPDGETIIMSGGYHNKTDHNYVTRLKFQYLKISKS